MEKTKNEKNLKKEEITQKNRPGKSPVQAYLGWPNMEGSDRWGYAIARYPATCTGNRDRLPGL